MIVKVCGMREAENIRAVEALSIDLMGFIFYPKSSRNVSEAPSYLPASCKRVGVFVNASAEEIMEKVSTFHLDFVQLHGDESPDFCRSLNGLKLIKMFQVSSAEDLKKTELYEGLADYFLFETKCQGYGGSGRQFDWNILKDYKGETPFLLTGGIGPEDAEKVKAFHHPRFAGIDLNSRFEIAPGIKDVQALKRFIDLINLN